MRELVIGVGDGAVSRDPGTTLVTYALGSCVALMIHDPVMHIGGMAHCMLPESADSQQERTTRPCKFADTAVPFLLRAVVELGGDRRRLVISAAGGAQIMDDNSMFNIGKRNCLAMRKALWKSGLLAHAEDTGGNEVRTVRMDLGSGRVWLQSPNGRRWELGPRVRTSSPTAKEASSWR